jgi:hypothetical protein
VDMYSCFFLVEVVHMYGRIEIKTFVCIGTGNGCA